MLYSYSKLRSFEKCPLQFRYRYLDRIPTTIESIEAFAGKRVHEVLEALFRALDVDPHPPSIEELIRAYHEAWRRAWHDDISVVKADHAPVDYYRLGRRCLITFFRGNWPFTGDRTIGLEEKIEFHLEGADGPRLTGVIDRVAVGERGEIAIHDYKTSTYLPRKDEILSDLQLAIYQMGTASRWPQAADIKLVWHFLAFGRRITVRLGMSGLEEKRTEVARRISAIEHAVASGQLPARVSPLCRWCAYQNLCPAQSDAASRLAAGALPPLDSWLPSPSSSPAEPGDAMDPSRPPQESIRRLQLPPLEGRRGQGSHEEAQVQPDQVKLL